MFKTKNISGVRFFEAYMDAAIISAVERHNTFLCGLAAAVGLLFAATYIAFATNLETNISNESIINLSIQTMFWTLAAAGSPVLVAVNDKFGRILAWGVATAFGTLALYNLAGSIYFRSTGEISVVLWTITLFGFIGVILSYRIRRAIERHVQWIIDNNEEN